MWCRLLLASLLCLGPCILHAYFLLTFVVTGAKMRATGEMIMVTLVQIMDTHTFNIA